MAARWGTPEGTVRESVDALYQIVSVMEHDEAAGGALVSRVLEVTEALAVLADELEARGESERELELAIVYAGGPEGWKSWLLDDRAPADAPPLSPRTVRMARALLEEDDRPRTRWEWSQLLAVLEESAGSDQALARIRASAAKHSAEDEREAKAHVAAGTREGVEELLRRLDVAEARLDASRAPARRRASSAAEAKHGSPRARTTARA